MKTSKIVVSSAKQETILTKADFALGHDIQPSKGGESVAKKAKKKTKLTRSNQIPDHV